MDMSKKPTDVSELEFIVGHYCKRVAEFLALCGAMIALQAVLSILNPANPPDVPVADHERAKRIYLACVRSTKNLLGYEWNMAIKACAAKHADSLYRPIDLPPR